MGVLSVVGNRPQFIKSAPLSVALRQAGIAETVLHSGQHWDPAMSQVFFDELSIPEPAYRLDLRTSDIDALTGPIRDVVERERPDWVLVYGDTNTTAAGARAAGDLPVAHVEAGLRSFDLSMPEERNRIEVDERSALLLAPDTRSAEQLAREGIGGRVEVVGDVMADATRIFEPIARRLAMPEGPYTVATIHRQANTEPDRLRAIVAGLAESGRPFIFPVHPRTRRALEEHDISLPGNVEAINPLGYLTMLALLAGADAVLTDSGGLQKEAYWLHVPCVTVRPSTEWVDTVAAGANTLVEPPELAHALEEARYPDDAPTLYGDGHAAERVASALYP
ncbi:MAG TPA: UDP-N-acetyl glucosamine 2-epimerase [Gaiellaceae bacterium]|nr:UDP-N-acetyl glucosamine 2-epimerase [Gaiellaceae bacterium]